MKPNHHVSRNLRRCSAFLAIATILSLPAFASAQAQKKGAEKLMQPNTIKTIADAETVQAGDLVVMSCPKYRTSWVTVVEPATKTGAKPDTKFVARHACPGCAQKFVTECQGKASNTKLIHVCKNCGSEDAFCCVMKHGAGATAGMEK